MSSCSVMEWNTKTALQWDWENLVMFSGKVNEIPKTSQQPNDWGVEGDGGGIDNGSFYSPPGGGRGGAGAGGHSGSDLGNGSSSKSSISASIDSSGKVGSSKSKFNFDTVEDSTNHPARKRELGRVEDTGSSPTVGVSVVGSGEPLIGLRLGKRTYFEDVCAGSLVKPSSYTVIPAAVTKRSRASYQSMQTPRCQVEGCDLDLTSAKDYHRRHRVCESHSKCPKVTVAGLERRFCQQCSRFHDLAEFDEKKRSCRRRLSDHNSRRRKPPPESIHFSTGRLSSPFYDGRQQMSFILNRVPLVHTTYPALNPTWERRTAKPEEGLEASTLAASNLDPTTDFRRALSLLSRNSSWDSSGTDHPEPSSLNQLMHANHTGIAKPLQQPVIQQSSVPHGWPAASTTEYWHPSEQQPTVATSHFQEQQQQQYPNSSQSQNNNSSSHFQEFQLFKTPYENGFYSPNQLT
ncbi:hypothetical protein MKW92_026464 [Papaver armeniacum]|nr:hypothetical protein MKW92_026464 [Papaver armeniacum]